MASPLPAAPGAVRPACLSLPAGAVSRRAAPAGVLRRHQRPQGKDLAGLPKDHCDLLSETYGTDLHKAICDSRGVVNIHFADGIYTEYPRLLSSYLAGKPVLSEKLGAELVEGRDYGTLGQDHTDHQLRTIFSSFCSGFAARHRLTDFLRRIAGP